MARKHHAATCSLLLALLGWGGENMTEESRVKSKDRENTDSNWGTKIYLILQKHHQFTKWIIAAQWSIQLDFKNAYPFCSSQAWLCFLFPVHRGREWRLSSVPVHSVCFLLLLPPESENFSQSSTAASWHPSHRRQPSTNFFYQDESFPWAVILPVTNHSSVGIPQSHNLLWAQCFAPAWDLLWSVDGILPHS